MSNARRSFSTTPILSSRHLSHRRWGMSVMRAARSDAIGVPVPATADEAGGPELVVMTENGNETNGKQECKFMSTWGGAPGSTAGAARFPDNLRLP
jgi:hypothetical protein